MIGFLLGFLGTFFQELNNSITKDKTKKYHFITVAVISSFFSLLLFSGIWIFKYFSWNFELSFALASIPLLIIRWILEVFQSYFTILAIKHCDRSTFSIIRIITIPLLVFADILLWYDITSNSLIWIWIILVSFLLFNFNTKTINWNGWYYVLFTAINAVLTISLFKYSISHYWNSVEIDQFFMILATFLFFAFYNYKRENKIWFYLLKKEKIFRIQWIFMAIASILISYTYVHFNASEATTLKRAWEMFWSIMAGFLFFKETHFWKKIWFSLCIMAGLGVMIL